VAATDRDATNLVQDWVVLNHGQLNNMSAYFHGMSYEDLMRVKGREVST
jgi:hypothetical protein